MAPSVGACLARPRPWVPPPALHGPGAVEHVCNPSIQQVEAGGLVFEASLGYVKPTSETTYRNHQIKTATTNPKAGGRRFEGKSLAL